METYRQYCPLAKALEIAGERWTLLIVRELLAGAQHFNEIARGLPGIPRSLLADRLKRLEHAQIVRREAAGQRVRYVLTDAGQSLQDVVNVMGRWGVDWAFGPPREEELDPVLLLWWMRRRLVPRYLPGRRAVVEFNFTGARRGRYWLVVEEDGEASVCLHDPRFQIDVLVTADIAAFYEVWLGRMPMRRARDAGLITIEGSPAMEHSFPRWFALSPMAGYVRGPHAYPA
ncbi:MAG: winged helix-turn-helix transcriptional regulator [Alphaproteobacteria bacterium]